eukprot:TRINITY_DN2715_c0_g1_i1.p8 TRINITY_DN2715_c0_g1~~TRINITY_DN2715_c0_g1_i1.p8  ORF type:complete len:100 (-),score=2.07 TRINITY_DN2715_c0_g1_i1:1911-2210(-)
MLNIMMSVLFQGGGFGGLNPTLLHSFERVLQLQKSQPEFLQPINPSKIVFAGALVLFICYIQYEQLQTKYTVFEQHSNFCQHDVNTVLIQSTSNIDFMF